MRSPRVRFTVRGMMVVTATLAISVCMFLGVANLIAYVGHAGLERDRRKDAAIWEAKGEPGRASESRESADLQARLKQGCLSRGATTLALLGLGIGLQCFVLAVRATYGAESLDRSGLVKALAEASSVGTKVLLVALVLAGVAYVVCMLLILAED